MSKRSAIPATESLPQAVARVVAPMKERLEIIAGERRGFDRIVALPEGATNDDIINKINEIIERIQG